MVVPAYNASTWEMVAEESGVQGYLSLATQKFKVSLSSVRLFKNKPPKAGGITQENKALFTMYKALGSIPSMPKVSVNILTTTFYPLDKRAEAKPRFRSLADALMWL